VRFADGWLREWGNHPIILTEGPEITAPRPHAGAWQAMAGAGGTPSPAMLKVGATLSTDSAVARCPALRAYLDRRHIGHGASAERAVAGKFQAEQSYPLAVLSMSLPGVSPDGGEALVATGSLFGPEAGGGELRLLRRKPDGSWSTVSAQRTWIT
jgi:hypothetical protein